MDKYINSAVANKKECRLRWEESGTRTHQTSNTAILRIHCFLNTRRHAISDMAANAVITSNPGTSFSSPCAGVVTGDVVEDTTVGVCTGDVTGVDAVAGVSTGDTAGEGVTASAVVVEVSYFAFHAVIPPSML